jgi:hypothetical protein
MVGVNSRALRLAQRAESCRISRNNPGVREAEYNQRCNRCLTPETRSRKQFVNTDRQAVMVGVNSRALHLAQRTESRRIFA